VEGILWSENEHGQYTIALMFGVLFSILLQLAQPAHTGTVVGVVRFTDTSKVLQGGRVVLLPPTYTEAWNKQVQTRLDNYWEMFKPEFIARKETFTNAMRAAQIEAFRYVTSDMRRDLGLGASKLMKDVSNAGQFEFSGIPLGTYQLLVQGTLNGEEMIWSKPVEVQSDVPIFVDLGKPVS
jgi:hypothetical protein